jgi:hypothetical protein
MFDIYDNKNQSLLIDSPVTHLNPHFEALTCPYTPKCYELRNVPQLPFSSFESFNPTFESLRSWGVHHGRWEVFGFQKWGTNHPLASKGDLHKHDLIKKIYLWTNTTSINITIRTCDDGFCPLVELIMGSQLSRIMVAISVKTFVDMVSGVLNVVPPNLIFNALFYKRTLIMNARHNHIIKNNYWCSYSMLWWLAK